MAKLGDDLTPQQIARQDFVDNEIHLLLEKLAGETLEWDISHIGRVRDVIQEIVCDELKLMYKSEFHPFIVL